MTPDEMSEGKSHKDVERAGEDSLVPLREARVQVETVITRLALLHLAYSKMLVK